MRKWWIRKGCAIRGSESDFVFKLRLFGRLIVWLEWQTEASSEIQTQHQSDELSHTCLQQVI